MIGEDIPLSLLEHRMRDNMPAHKKTTLLKLLAIKYMKIKEIEVETQKEKFLQYMIKIMNTKISHKV